MDSVKRNTLNLMELATFQLPVDKAGYHLVLIAADWIREEETARATYSLSLISDDFLENDLVKLSLIDKEIARAIALLVDVLKITDFRIFKKKGIQA